MPDRTVVTRYEAKVSGAVAGVEQLRLKTKQLGDETLKTSAKQKQHLDNTSKALAVAGGALAALVTVSVKRYAEFEQQMSKVAAVTGATIQQQQQLGRVAIKAGQDTVFSATEAADAEAELAKAGVSAADIMGGALAGSLNLAAAGNVSLAKSAEVSAQAMNIFGKRGDEVGHIADVLTAGANKSAAGVDDLGLALNQSGLVAKQWGLTLEDTVGVLSAFADNALKGSDGGTSLRNMLARLNPQTDEAKNLMKDLGLNFFDANGQFIGIEKTAGLLQDRLGKLSQQERDTAVQTIFGQDAQRGANILIEQGEKGVRAYVDAVNDQGAAQRMAAKQTDNLMGDLEQLKGTLESAFINAGSGGAEGIRSLVQGLTDLIDKFNELDPETQAWVLKAAAATSGALLLAAGVSKVLGILGQLQTSYQKTTVAGSKFESMLGSGAKKAGIFAAAMLGVNEALSFFQDDNDFHIRQLGDDITRGVDPAKALNTELARLAGDAPAYARNLKSLGDIINTVLNPDTTSAGGEDRAAGVLKAVSLGMIDLQTQSDVAKDRLSSVDKVLAQMVSKGNAKGAAQQVQDLVFQQQLYGHSADDVMAVLPEYQNALDQLAVNANGAIKPTGDLADKTSVAAGAAADAAQATSDYVDALKGLNQPQIDAREAAIKVAQSLADIKEEIDKTSPALNKSKTDFNLATQAGRDQSSLLNQLAQDYIAQQDALQATGASQEQLDAKLTVSRGQFIKTAKQMGLTGDAAKALADKILGVPTSHGTTFTANTKPANAAIDALQAKISAYDGKTFTAYLTTKTTAPTTTGGLADLLAPPKTKKAGGGSVLGAGTGTSDSIPALLSNGEHVWTADEVQKAGGQDAMYRARAAVRSGALRFSKGGGVGYADGGAADIGAVLEILRDFTSYGDVLDSRRSTNSAVESLRRYQAALAAANRAIAKARTTKGRDDDLRALEQRRRAVVAIAKAEDQVTAARKAQARVTKDYQLDKRSYILRATEASAQVNAGSKKFLDNIDTLMKRGFKVLALSLLEQGGPEAATLADQAVKSTARAQALSTQFSLSASLAARESALRDALTGNTTSADARPLSPYAELRDLRPSTISQPAVQQVTIDTTINGAVDPVGTVQQLEKLLQAYTIRTGQPVRFNYEPAR